MSVHALRSSFNGGEISPLMDARVDAERYSFSCRKLENFIPRIYGGAFSRPGMMFLGSVGDESEEAVLIPFNVSATTRYMLELGDQYLRVWNSEGELELDKVNSPYTEVLSLATPYAAADLFEIKFVQLNNVCFLTHPDYPVQKFQRTFDASYAAFSWSFNEIAWDYPCFRSTNQTAATATPSGTTGAITLSFSANVFTEALTYSEYVGSRIQVSQRRESSFIDLDLDATAVSSAIDTLGGFTMTTYGVWSGTLTIQRKDAAGNWEDVRTFEAANERNIIFDGYQESTAEIRLSYTHVTAGSSSPKALLELADSRRVGMVEIDSVGFSGSLPVVNCTVIDDLDSTDATTEWALEAWGEYSGYPRAVTFHEQRLWFGGTELEPNTFWASATDDFLNFRRGAYDADALSFTLGADEGSSIESMLSHEHLVIFTQTEEWTATTSEQTAITPSNIFVRRKSRTGSDSKRPFIALNNILHVQRGGRNVGQFTYGAGLGDGVSQNLTRLSEHITKSGIKQTAFQQQPDPIIWIVLNNGNLISVTYNPQESVIAWARHPTDGLVESVGVIYGDQNSADEVWLTVKREELRNVERIDPDAITKIDDDELDNFVYLDSSRLVTSAVPQKTFSGFLHLEGRTVNALADGEVIKDLIVSDSRITLDTNASTVVVGLPYEPTLQPSKVEIPMEDGTAQGRTWVCKNISFNLWKTRGLRYADSPDAIASKWFDYSFRSPDTALGEPEPLFTGTIRVNNLGAHGDNVNITVKQELPLPCNILGMIPELDITGE